MSAASFGYTAGDGTGTNQSGPAPGTHTASWYTNTTGATVYVASVDLIQCTAGGTFTAAQIGLYSNLADSHPWRLLAVTNVLTAIAVGTTTFTLATPLAVPPGATIWVALRTDGTPVLRFDGCTATGRLAVSTTSGSTAFADFGDDFPDGARSNFILPAVLHGDTVGPGTATNLRAAEVLSEPLAQGLANIRAALLITEPLADATSTRNLRAALVVLETLLPVPPEPIMVTTTLPGFGNSPGTPSLPAALDPLARLRGLTFDVHKKPQFNTRASQLASLSSIRTPLAAYPNWEYELNYSFLEDASGANSSLKQMMGCFLTCNGKALPFLFKDPDDYITTGSTLATGDGGTLQFDFMRAIGGFSEPIGQVDTANTINVYLTIAETDSVPGTGPYTVTVAHAAAFSADGGVKIGGTALTKVASAPAAMQYSVAAGVYTFNSAQHGASAVITYSYLIDPSAYSVVLPNKLLFVSAPASGAIISADFQYFFTCFFDDDTVDFHKFASTLWELQSLTFHSELLA